MRKHHPSDTIITSISLHARKYLRFSFIQRFGSAYRSNAGRAERDSGILFRIGSRHEPVELNGVSHFIEHAVFKGTQKRTALDIAIEQDRLGGNLDAFTTHEETGFAIKVIDDQLPKAFELIADMLADPSFDDADLKSEQRVIIEEIKMLEDSPEEFLGEIFNEAFFPITR